MILKMKQASEGFAGHVIIIPRILDVPHEHIWEGMIGPEQVVHWFGAEWLHDYHSKKGHEPGRRRETCHAPRIIPVDRQKQAEP